MEKHFRVCRATKVPLRFTIKSQSVPIARLMRKICSLFRSVFHKEEGRRREKKEEKGGYLKNLAMVGFCEVELLLVERVKCSSSYRRFLFFHTIFTIHQVNFDVWCCNMKSINSKIFEQQWTSIMYLQFQL